MRVSDIPEIAELTIPEKILLVEDLWDNISTEEGDIPLPESHIRELDTRLKKFKANTGKLLSMEELQARVNSRK